MANTEVTSPESGFENLYVVKLGAVAGTAGAIAVRYSEMFGYKEKEDSEEWMSFEMNILDNPLALLLTEESGDIVFDYPKERIWTGKNISLSHRTEKDPSLADRVEKVLEPDNFRKYIVAVNMKAPSRCIDGRPISGWSEDRKLQLRGLGPKIAGATAHAALAHRIVDSDSLTKEIKAGRKFGDDILDVISTYQKAGIGFGIHIDDHAEGSNTGCGAIDNIDKILDKVRDHTALQQIRGLTHTILGDYYDRDVINEFYARMAHLDAIKPRYMPRENDDPDGEFLYKKTIVETVKKAADEHHEPVEQLEGKHNEVALMLNFVEGTTIDTDRLSSDTDGEIQVFGWDVWELFNEAERLFPFNNMDKPDTQKKALEQRVKHVTARTILGIATAMVLTDGSLKVGLLQPVNSLK